jgi:hypothetical protein
VNYLKIEDKDPDLEAGEENLQKKFFKVNIHLRSLKKENKGRNFIAKFLTEKLRFGKTIYKRIKISLL